MAGAAKITGTKRRENLAPSPLNKAPAGLYDAIKTKNRAEFEHDRFPQAQASAGG
jgi:hypothetical protein